jgi:hypothetical protein
MTRPQTWPFLGLVEFSRKTPFLLRSRRLLQSHIVDSNMVDFSRMPYPGDVGATSTSGTMAVSFTLADSHIQYQSSTMRHHLASSPMLQKPQVTSGTLILYHVYFLVRRDLRGYLCASSSPWHGSSFIPIPSVLWLNFRPPVAFYLFFAI